MRPLAYDDDHVCHCACGIPDPDCADMLPVSGCTNDEICTPEGTCTSCGNAVVDEGEGFGDSSNEEMCFTGMYKYPAGGTLFQCALN